ncbi:hypothetical protein B600_0650 [Chlamydia psittaci VS225]|nr:hypothetical protein B600_0650 [Chlamydia psittaci VS225]
MYFQGGEKSGKNIVFYSTISPAVLEVSIQPKEAIPRSRWKSCSQIDVYWTSLILEDFVRYRVSDETAELSRQLMYAKELVKIERNDFCLRFFYVRGGDGIGSIDLRFKDFFSQTIVKERIASGNTNDYIPLINEKYRDHLELKLGSETFSLAILAAEFLSTHHVTSLEHHKNVPYLLEIPTHIPRFPKANIFTYTIDSKANYTSWNDFRWLPISPSMKKYELPGLAKRGASYYLDSTSGDLYLTRIILFGETGVEALLIKFPNYKCKWREFQDIIVMVRNILTIANSNTIFRSGTMFSGPAIQHVRFSDALWMRRITQSVAITSIETGVNSHSEPVVYSDFMKGGGHRSQEDYGLWDLRDRFNKSDRSRIYDYYLLKEAIHLCEEEQKWQIPESMLEYAFGYYSQVSSTWISNQIAEGTKLFLPANSITMSLITSQGAMFTKQQEMSGCVVHYRLGGLNKVAKHVIFIQVAGEIWFKIKTGISILVKKVDESQYPSGHIYVVAEVIGEDSGKTKLF